MYWFIFAVPAAVSSTGAGEVDYICRQKADEISSKSHWNMNVCTCVRSTDWPTRVAVLGNLWAKQTRLSTGRQANSWMMKGCTMSWSNQSKTAFSSTKTDESYFWNCCQLLFSDDVTFPLPGTVDDGTSRQPKWSNLGFFFVCSRVCFCTGMRQGNDIGTTYRSAIYTYTKQQLEEALASKEQYQKVREYIRHLFLWLADFKYLVFVFVPLNIIWWF